MIVGDLRPGFERAIASAEPFVDEIVVVDTSANGLVQHWQFSAAKAVKLAWCDDFSAARNFSLDQATGDWIFWMDADDVLPAASDAAIRKAISEHPNHTTRRSG